MSNDNNIVFLLCCLVIPGVIVIIALSYLLFAKSREYSKKIKVAESAMDIERKARMQAEADAIKAAHSRWLRESLASTYVNELEVEIKFIYPLVRFLGYSNNDIRARVTIEIHVGRQKATGISDWVIYRNEIPFLVIEAKEYNQVIGSDQRNQGRSYAYALNAPYYMITNGKVIEVYERRVDVDALKINKLVSTSSEWSDLFDLLGLK